MSLNYPAEAIPEADRCPDCKGSGDRWALVYCCVGPHSRVECACGGQPQWEPVDECGSCGGTGRPTPEQWERIDAATHAHLVSVRRRAEGLTVLTGGYDGGRS